MEGEDYGMAALEEWVAFFEEKGCEEWVGVADLRLSLKDAYTRMAIGLRTGSEEKEAMLRQTLALGEELKEFKPHPDDPMPWLEGTHRVVRETTEMVRGLGDQAEGRRLEREAQERRMRRMQILGMAFLVVSGGDWVLGGVAATTSHREADSSRMNGLFVLLSLPAIRGDANALRSRAGIVR